MHILNSWYIVDYKLQKNGNMQGMAIAGPFATKDISDEELVRKRVSNRLLSPEMANSLSGPNMISPNWKKSIFLWNNGDLELD
jgi:hypothetical protein